MPGFVRHCAPCAKRLLEKDLVFTDEPNLDSNPQHVAGVARGRREG
ncbi:MAG TPA: hypothetical protein VFC18_18975 [Burkholderiales bacterium]|nr:hypothetical protein [Burkholderiales bacterium]